MGSKFRPNSSILYIKSKFRVNRSTFRDTVNISTNFENVSRKFELLCRNFEIKSRKFELRSRTFGLSDIIYTCLHGLITLPYRAALLLQNVKALQT